MKISVAIPVYDMNGKGVQFLERSLEMLEKQTFQDFEVVISDNSQDDKLKKIALMGWGFQVCYNKNEGRKNMGGNINNAISKCQGDYIKFLFQDDYLTDENSLQEIAQTFDFDWLVTGCSNHMFPYYSADIKKGNNTIGSPSVLAIRNDKPLLFNENLQWVIDCEYYIRLYKRYGLPVVLNTNNVTIYTGEHQTTSKLSDEEKLKEIKWLCES